MNTIKVLFFGQLSEMTGQSEIEIDPSGTDDIATLEQYLQAKYPALGQKTYNVALNQILVNDNPPLSEGDEVAFLPPYAGG